jgi:hypothetical protein
MLTAGLLSLTGGFISVSGGRNKNKTITNACVFSKNINALLARIKLFYAWHAKIN